MNWYAIFLFVSVPALMLLTTGMLVLKFLKLKESDGSDDDSTFRDVFGGNPDNLPPAEYFRKILTRNIGWNIFMLLLFVFIFSVAAMSCLGVVF